MPNDDNTVKPAEPQKPKRKIRFVKCLITAVIAVSIVAISVGGFLYFNIYLPQGTGPAGPVVPAEPFKRVWSEQNVTLLGLGDSITGGSGAREGFSYLDRLAKNPRGDADDMRGKSLSAVFPNLTPMNVASSGSTSIDHLVSAESLQKFPKDVLGIVVFTTGGNDLIHTYGRQPAKEGAMYGATIEQALDWIDNFQKRLDLIIDRLNHVFPAGCQIFLANIYDPTDGTGDTKAWFTGLPPWPDALSILEAYNDVLSQCAEKYENVHLVDIHKPFLGHGMHCRKFWLANYRKGDPTYWYHLNIEDPGERGHDAIRRLFLNEMLKVFYDANDRHKVN